MTRPKRAKSKSAGSIEWTARALADLRAIDDYTARDNRATAERWIGKLIATAEAAARLPLTGRVVPEKPEPTCARSFFGTTASGGRARLPKWHRSETCSVRP